MLVFVSYCLRDSAVVKALILQLGVLGHNVLYEPKMPAGQIRWSHVLESIKACDVFLLATTNQALKSESRALELQYARRIGKPVQALLLEDITDILPAEFGQAIKYNPQSKQDNDLLDRAIKAKQRTSPPTQPERPQTTEPVDPDWRIPLMKLHTLIRAQSISMPDQQWTISNIQEFLERQETYRAARQLLKSFAARRDLDENVLAEVEETVKQLKQSYVSQQRARWRNIGLASLFVLGLLVVALFFLYRRQQGINRAIEATQSEQAIQVTQTGFVLNKDMTNTALPLTETAAFNQTQTAMPTATMTLTPTLTPTLNPIFIYESIFATSGPEESLTDEPAATVPAADTPSPTEDISAMRAEISATMTLMAAEMATRTLLPPVTPSPP